MPPNGGLFHSGLGLSTLGLSTICGESMKPRDRMIKYDFFVNEELGSLPALTRLLFIGMWCLADREGRLKNRPAQLKAQILPYDENADVEKMLQELEDKGALLCYKVENSSYIWIKNFVRHQRIHPKEVDSQLPDPQADTQAWIKHEQPCAKHISRGRSRSNSRSRGRSRELETIPEIVMQVIDDLNEVLGSKYKSSTEPYRKAILARAAEGYSLEDFQAVHRGQHQEWGSDPKMSQHLTPATLYRPGNFPKYLANATRTKAPQLNDTTKQILETKRRFLESTSNPTDKKELPDV